LIYYRIYFYRETEGGKDGGRERLRNKETERLGDLGIGRLGEVLDYTFNFI
jgi:hypothetical protein